MNSSDSPDIEAVNLSDYVETVDVLRRWIYLADLADFCHPSSIHNRENIPRLIS